MFNLSAFVNSITIDDLFDLVDDLLARVVWVELNEFAILVGLPRQLQVLARNARFLCERFHQLRHPATSVVIIGHDEQALNAERHNQLHFLLVHHVRTQDT